MEFKLTSVPAMLSGVICLVLHPTSPAASVPSFHCLHGLAILDGVLVPQVMKQVGIFHL